MIPKHALFLFLLTSCQQQSFVAYTEYISPQKLASYHVNTPDPKRTSPDQIGQALIMSWSLHKPFAHSHIHAHIILNNQQHIHLNIPIQTHSGTTSYKFTGYDYIASQGIQSFQCQLIQNDHILFTTQHPLFWESPKKSDTEKKCIKPLDTTRKGLIDLFKRHETKRSIRTE